MNSPLTRLARLPLAFTAVLCASLLASVARSDELPRVAIFATGGTIAGVQATPGAAAYKPGVLTLDHLLSKLPGLEKVARLDGEQIANIASQDITAELWLHLARRAAERLADPDVAGVVITHGTDTMEETAWFLRLVLRSEKPVVLTGAMLPATDPAADGPVNLRSAVATAASPAARGYGPLLLLNGELHSARDVRKTATEAIDTFQSPNDGPVGSATPAGPVFTVSANSLRPAPGDGFDLAALDAAKLPRVAIVSAHGDVDGTVVDALLALPAERRPAGIVLSGVGNGNASAPLLAALERASREGIIVVRSARAGRGLVNRNMEVDDDKLGWIAARALSPQKARILLVLGLTRTRDLAELQRLFDEA
jgi:L-asparaginases, type II